MAKGDNNPPPFSGYAVTIIAQCRYDNTTVILPLMPPIGHAGFEHAQQFKSCYKLMTKKRTWPEARQRCQGLGADLVALTTKKKNDYIVDVAIKVNSGSPLERT